MQHTECYTERFRQRCLTMTFFLLSFPFNLLLSMVVKENLAGQSNFIGRNYLSFINRGATLNMDYYEKLFSSLLTCMTICIESCGTGDISSSRNCNDSFPLEVSKLAGSWLVHCILRNKWIGCMLWKLPWDWDFEFLCPNLQYSSYNMQFKIHGQWASKHIKWIYDNDYDSTAWMKYCLIHILFGTLSWHPDKNKTY